MFKVFVTYLLAAVLWCGPVQAEDVQAEEPQPEEEQVPEVQTGQKAIWSFLVENDSFSTTDRNYTNGVRIGYLSAPGRGQGLARRLLGAKPGDTTRIGIAFGQSIFTPQDIEATAPLPGQHPYAGWLYGEYSVHVERKNNVYDTLVIDLGIVGPAALGRQVQNNFHDLIGIDGATGWSNQLRNEPGFVVTFERQWRSSLPVSKRIAIDLTPSAGLSAGNVLTQGKAGLTLRIGRNLAGNYGPARIRPSLAAAGSYRSAASPSWYAFIGAEGRAVVHNIFLDGSTFRNSLSVNKRHLVADIQAGMAVQIGDAQITYTYVWRTREFKTQTQRHEFGAVSISTKF